MSWTSYTLRSEGILLSAEVHRYLRIIAKAASGIEKVTKDQVADNLIREIVLKQYPHLVTGQKKIEQIEKEMITTIHETPA